MYDRDQELAKLQSPEKKQAKLRKILKHEDEESLPSDGEQANKEEDDVDLDAT